MMSASPRTQSVLAAFLFLLLFAPVSLASAVEVIVDNGSAGTASTGTWIASFAPNPYGANSVYANGAGTNPPAYTWQATLPQPGVYDVYLWWTVYIGSNGATNRSSSVPVRIDHSGGSQTLLVNQQKNGGQWNKLGTFTFGSSGTVRLTASGSSSLTFSADAVRFVSVGPANVPPVATIDSLSPNPAQTGQVVDFRGHGADSDGVITGYGWRSSIDGPLSSTASFSLATLSPGTHTIFFKVQDDKGAWSPEVSAFLTITQGGGGASFGFVDDFGADTTGTYTVTNTLTQGGLGKFLYDNVGMRALMITGSTVGLRVSRSVEPASAGLFLADFTPIGKYGTGSRFSLRLLQDSANYYEVYNSDGLGPGWVRKVVGGQVVDNVPLSSGYVQYTWYPVKIAFGPASTKVELFNQTVILGGNTTALTVKEFSLELQQQDAYLDTLIFTATDRPFAVAAQPQGLYLQGGSTLTARAKAGNLPAGGGVRFTLDAGLPTARTIVDTTEPYEAAFAGLPKKEYALDVAAVDGAGAPVAGSFVRDRELPVGIGDYYVAIGDSITFGESDDLTADNVSQDGRVAGGGYPPLLSDFLTEQRGYPSAVYNDGVPGGRAVNGVGSIPGTLADHPNSQYILVMYGTNDSRVSTPSGLGLKPGDPGYTVSYKYSLQRIIWSVKNKKKIPIIAKAPPVWGDCATCTRYANPQSAPRNALIREYNMVIDELVEENFLPKQGPDFYAYFSGHPEEFADNYHPNGAGYRSMGHLWLNALLQ